MLANRTALTTIAQLGKWADRSTIRSAMIWGCATLAGTHATATPPAAISSAAKVSAVSALEIAITEAPREGMILAAMTLPRKTSAG